MFPNGGYSTHMGTTQAADIASATSRNITNAIEDKGLTNNATAIKAGIPTTTFDRKLKTRTEKFTIEELGNIANVLEVPFVELFKDAA